MQLDLTATAIDMARRGYAIFPLIENGKTPSLAANWRDISTTDLDTVSDWPPGDNIGIDTGKSGLVVVDVDTKSGPGIKTWNAILSRFGGLHDWPETLTVRTPSGGLHFYFTAGNAAMRNSASMIGKSVDIRAQGGYVVGWDSVVDGKHYGIIHDDPPMPVPQWLADLERRCRKRKTSSDLQAHAGSVTRLRMLSRAQRDARIAGLSEKLAGAVPGERNNMLHWTACRLGELAAAGQVIEEDAWELVVRATYANGHMDWGEAGVRATFLSGFERGVKGVR